MRRWSSDEGSTSTASKADGVSAAVVYERDLCAGIASDVSSSCPGAGRGTELAPTGDEAELELGLSLGARKAAAVNAPWGECCRILTAKDFPSAVVASRGSPVSPSSSSASSSPPGGGGREGGGRVGGVGVAGAKRPADSVAAEVGSHSTSQVVGWPPVRAYRMHNLMNHCKESSNDNNSNSGNHKKAACPTDNVHHNRVKENITVGECEKKGLVGGSLFVKVNMDGMPIGRKVDLSVHRTYETLALALEGMFQETGSLHNPLRSAKTSKLLDGTSEFVLTYEDKDGDWMLVGDVPWGMFLSTVKRLRIMRTSGANGLAIRCQSSKVGG